MYEKGCFTKAEYDKIYPSVSNPRILSGAAKVPKLAKDNCPTFRPILSVIDTPSYNVAKFLILVLLPLTEGEFTVQV